MCIIQVLGFLVFFTVLIIFIRSVWWPRENIYSESDTDFHGEQGSDG